MTEKKVSKKDINEVTDSIISYLIKRESSWKSNITKLHKRKASLEEIKEKELCYNAVSYHHVWTLLEAVGIGLENGIDEFFPSKVEEEYSSGGSYIYYT